MAQTSNDAQASRREYGNWRHRETRAASKYVSKRITEQDHIALTRYAEDHGVKVAELLTPFVNELLQRAHEHCGDLPASARAS